MTTEKFITMLVAYYGINAKADAVKLSVVTEYVAQFSDMQRKELFNKAIALFSPTSTNPHPYRGRNCLQSRKSYIVA